MGFLKNIFGDHDNNSTSSNEMSVRNEVTQKQENARGDLSESVIQAYESQMIIAANNMKDANYTPQAALPAGLTSSDIMDVALIGELLRKTPENIRAYFNPGLSDPDPHKSPYDRGLAQLRLSLEAYARYGALIPTEVIDYLEKAWCFLDLSDAIDFYCG